METIGRNLRNFPFLGGFLLTVCVLLTCELLSPTSGGGPTPKITTCCGGLILKSTRYGVFCYYLPIDQIC